jgi:hypothetical protein
VTAYPTADKEFTIFMLVRTTPEWLALSPEKRFGFLGEAILPILGRHQGVALRFFDAEAYSARVSDVAVWTTRDLPAFQSIVEELRETKFWGAYFEIVEILLSVENGYAAHYREAPVQ